MKYNLADEIKIDGCFRVDVLHIDEFIEKHRI